MAGRRKFLVGSLVYAVATLFERGALMGISFVASISLTPVEFSAFGRFQIAVTMIAGYATLGLSTLVAKLAAEISFSKPSNGARIKTLWAGSAVLALTFACVFIGGQGWVSGVFDPVQAALFVLCAMAIAGAAVGSSIFLGLEEYRKAFIVALSLFLALASALALVQGQSNALAYIAAFVFGNVIWGGLSAVMALSMLKSPPIQHRAALEHVREVFHDAAPLMVISAVSGSLMWIMSTLLIANTDSVEHAKFLIGIQWSAIVTFLPSVITRVVFPRMVKTASGAAHAGWANMRWLFLSSAAATVITVFAAGLLLLMADKVNSIYADEYTDLTRVIVVYVVCSIPASVANLFGNQLVAQGHIRKWLACSLTGAGVMVGLMQLWSAQGATAPAYAMACGYAVMILTTTRYLRGPCR
jgi:O-antigen/teichoic acid export membrane protein